MTRTEGYSGREIRMLCQLVENFSVERASVLFTKKIYTVDKYFAEKSIASH